jgi:2-polyprenyl-6-methoxyphenol hydroxylase-like FAD-dependent oxidoreductase
MHAPWRWGGWWKTTWPAIRLAPRLRALHRMRFGAANARVRAQGLGVAWMPWSMVQRDCQDGRLALAGDAAWTCISMCGFIGPNAD